MAILFPITRLLLGALQERLASSTSRSVIVPPIVVYFVITFSCFSFTISIRRHPMIAVSTTKYFQDSNHHRLAFTYWGNEACVNVLKFIAAQKDNKGFVNVSMTCTFYLRISRSMRQKNKKRSYPDSNRGCSDQNRK